MKQGVALAIGLIAVALAAGGGYWAGHRSPIPAMPDATPASPAAKKPLYYRVTRDGVAFASEVHALVTGVEGERPAVDLAGVDEYLTLGYVAAPYTVYQNVFKLRAAHYQVLTPGRVHEALSMAGTIGLENARLHVDWNQASIDSNRAM